VACPPLPPPPVRAQLRSWAWRLHRCWRHSLGAAAHRTQGGAAREKVGARAWGVGRGAANRVSAAIDVEDFPAGRVRAAPPARTWAPAVGLPQSDEGADPGWQAAPSNGSRVTGQVSAASSRKTVVRPPPNRPE
jgi:hypothetical protein